MHRVHYACLALIGLGLMLYLRGAVLPTWATLVLLPSVCIGTMFLGMRAMHPDATDLPPASEGDRMEV